MMADRVKLLHKVLHGEEGEKRNANGNHYAHLVNGKWHIGHGHCLDQEQSPEELDVLKLDDELDDWSKFTISDDQADMLFIIDVADARDGALISFTKDELDALDDARWVVVMSMCYQMGSVSKFKSFIKHAKAGEWEKAADEMEWSNGETKQRRSAWYKETPERCEEAADAMRAGFWIAYQDDPNENKTAVSGVEKVEVEAYVLRPEFERGIDGIEVQINKVAARVAKIEEYLSKL